jgi:hypothetical protein
MTIKTVTTIELKDIKSIEFKCGTCHTKIVYAMDKFTHPVVSCNVCKPDKQYIEYGSQDYADLIKLGQLIQRFSKLDSQIVAMNFEIMNSSVSDHA